MPALNCNIYIDGQLVLTLQMPITPDYGIRIVSDGVEFTVDGGYSWSQVYDGSGGRFLGLSTTQEATSPDSNLEIGDQFTPPGIGSYYYYSVYATPQPSSSGISVGTLSLAKAFAGTSEVIKAIYNGVTLYEKITSYSITVTLSNATAASGNPSTIAQGGTATLVFTFDGTNYICPTTSPAVTGATGTWTKNSDSQGTMVLSNANGNVSFTVAGEQALPQLDTPTNLSVTDTTASFDEVENAEKYEFFVDDVSIGEYPTVTLISFSVIVGAQSITYQAEDGMTWEQWVGSGYNTDGFSLSGNNVRIPGSSGMFVALSTIMVLKTDTIVANQAYTTVTGD